jgi:hypothetical protein
LQKILAEIQKVLLYQTCNASRDILNREEIDKYPDQSPESSIEVHIAKPLDLTCPHADCKATERVIYTKKPNLLRHYQSRESFHSKLQNIPTITKIIQILPAMRNALSVVPLLVVFASGSSTLTSARRKGEA